MSQSEVERFAADMKSNAVLRAEAEKTPAAKSRATHLEQATAFAASKGYKFTLAHAREYVKAKAKAAGKPLTDAELDAVAGGTGPQGVQTRVLPVETGCISLGGPTKF